MRRILLLLVVAFNASADVVLDQEQPLVEPAHGVRAVGEKLAQTVTASVSRRLVEVHVPVACGSGEVILEIFSVTASGAPRSPLFAREHRPTGVLPRLTDQPAFIGSCSMRRRASRRGIASRFRCATRPASA
jgi:hypothetical protein